MACCHAQAWHNNQGSSRVYMITQVILAWAYSSASLVRVVQPSGNQPRMLRVSRTSGNSLQSGQACGSFLWSFCWLVTCSTPLAEAECPNQERCSPGLGGTHHQKLLCLIWAHMLFAGHTCGLIPASTYVFPPFAWHAGISDRYRQHAFSPLQCDLWSVNCPCVSWSQSGRKQGLHSEGGRVLICTTANAAMPLAICCEQGAEFQSHPDCEVVADLWQQAGFRIHREGVFDLQEVGPVRRRRYLSVLVRKVLPCAPGINVMSKWTSLGPFTPASEGATIEFPRPDVLKLYWNPELLPRTTSKNELTQC